MAPRTGLAGSKPTQALTPLGQVSRAMSIINVQDAGLNLIYAPVGHYKWFSRSPLCGAEPLVAPVRGGGGGGLHFALVRRALCIFAPRSTPNKLLLTAVTLSSQGRVDEAPSTGCRPELACIFKLSGRARYVPSFPRPHLHTMKFE
jgi:hypothetical protein